MPCLGLLLVPTSILFLVIIATTLFVILVTEPGTLYILGKPSPASCVHSPMPPFLLTLRQDLISLPREP